MLVLENLAVNRRALNSSNHPVGMAKRPVDGPKTPFLARIKLKTGTFHACSACGRPVVWQFAK
jgi:hypothetical protein